MNHVVVTANLGDLGLVCPMAKKLDGILSLLETLVHRCDLLFSQVLERYVVAVLLVHQSCQPLNGFSHVLSPLAAPSRFVLLGICLTVLRSESQRLLQTCAVTTA